MAFTILNDPAAPVNPAAFADQAEPDAVDFDILSAAHDGYGVVSGCAVTAQGTPDMTVAVAAGVILIAGEAVNVSGGNVTITAAHATLPRFDLVVVNSSGTKSAVAGTADANPCFPDIPATSVVLAAVYVPAADTAINTNQIIDKRLFVTAGLVPSPSSPHLSMGGTGKTNRISDVIELPTAGAPGALADFGRLYYGGSVFRQALSISALAFDFGIGGPSGLIFDKGQLGGWSAGVDALDGAWGLIRPVTLDGTPTFATDINGRGATFPTAATTGSDAGISTGLVFEKDAQPEIQIKFSLNHNTLVRFFCGLTDQTLATMVGSDTPAGSFVGLSFSTPRGDSNWKWINNDGVGGQATTDSGIAVDTAVHFMRLLTTAGNAIVTVLYNSSQVEQDANFAATNTIGLGTDARFVCGLETEENGVKSITAYYFTGMNNR